MAILQSEVVVFGVVRGGTLIALQDNSSLDLLVTTGTVGTWGRGAGAVLTSTNADVRNSFFVSGTDEALNVVVIPGDPNFTAALVAGDTLTVPFALSGSAAGNVTFYLRTIPTIDFLLVQNGSHAPVSANFAPPASYGAYDWQSLALTGLGGAPLAFTQTPPLTHQNAVLSVTTGNWNVDGATHQITIALTHNTFPARNSSSVFGTAVSGPSVPTLTLRALVTSANVALTGYTYMRGHANDGLATRTGLNAALPGGTTMTGTFTAGRPADWPVTPLAFDGSGRLAALASEAGITSWNNLGTLRALFTDGANVRPQAFVDGVSFRMRQMLPAGQTIQFDVTAGADALAFTGEAYAFDALVLQGGTSAITPNVGTGQLSWQQFQLRAGDASTIVATVHPSAGADNGYPRESFALPLNVTTPAVVNIGVTPGTLPGARARARYQTTLTATNIVVGGGSLEWYLDPLTDGLGLTIDSPTATTSGFLHTLPLGAIPNAWATPNPVVRPIKVRVVLRQGGVVVGTTDPVNPPVVNLPIQPTKANVNAVLMIDRSGSMADQNRWLGATSGAKFFAQLVQNTNSSFGHAHGVQAMWFGGWDDPASNYPTPQPATDPLNAGNYGTLTGDKGAGVIIPLTFANFVNDPGFIAAIGAIQENPFFWTAIGAGLLAARDALLVADPGNTKERVVFLFTDGMENRNPLIDPATQAGGAFWQHPNALPQGDPDTRIYGCALGTAQSFADGLATACNNTGGIGALDVKFIDAAGTPSGPQIASLIQNWFQSSFAALFGYTPVTAPDPELAGGATASHVVKVTEGQTKIVLSMLASAPSASDWTIDLQPPGGTGVITEADATAGVPGVQLLTGPLHKAFVVDLPLAVPGEGLRWAGDWTLHVTRNATTTGDYLFTAIAKQDITFQVALDAPVPTRVGNRVDVRARLALNDVGIDDAHVIAHVTTPGKWLDDVIARRVGRTPPAGIVVAAAKEPASDLTPVQRVVRDVLSTTVVKNKTFAVRLHATGNGFYEGHFIVDQPGTWEVRTTVDGLRRGVRDWAKWDRANEELKALLPLRQLEAERIQLGREAGAAQPFHIEDDQTLSVRFVPDVKHSRAGGSVSHAGLELFVVPEDDQGNLLGIGRASDIFFHADCGPALPSTDLGNGTYVARIPILGKNIRVVRGVLLGDHLVLGEGKNAMPICNGRLDLSIFHAQVLGVEIPVPIRAPFGKPTRADYELAFPTFTTTLGAAQATLAHVEREDPAKLAAAAKGLVPLLAALRRAVDVDFARTAEAVAVRRYGLYVARQALCGFCRDNGHDVALGKLAGDLEAVFDTVLTAWPLAHIATADACRDAFFGDADELRGLVQRFVAHLDVHVKKQAKA